MPVEIRELVIQARMDEPDLSPATQQEALLVEGAEEGEVSLEDLEDLRAAILLECKDYIQQYLEDRARR